MRKVTGYLLLDSIMHAIKTKDDIGEADACVKSSSGMNRRIDKTKG